MRLKLDENLGKRGQSILQAAGHDVSTVVHQQMGGATDQDLIEKCRRESRGLVSLDLDFANPLRFNPAYVRASPCCVFRRSRVMPI